MDEQDAQDLNYPWTLSNIAATRLDAYGNRMELRSNKKIIYKFLFAKRSCSGEAGSSDW